MKYYTKQWYKLMQYADLVSSLNVDINANYHNLKNYNTLYNQKESEFITKQISINKHLNQASNEASIIFDNVIIIS